MAVNEEYGVDFPDWDGHAVVRSQVIGAAHWVKDLLADVAAVDGSEAVYYYVDQFIEVLNEIGEGDDNYDPIRCVTLSMHECRLESAEQRGYSMGRDHGEAKALSEAAATPIRKRKPIPGGRRIAVFERDAYRCVSCQSWTDLTIDHIQPVARGGTNDIDNLQTLCRSCNSAKGTRVEHEGGA